MIGSVEFGSCYVCSPGGIGPISRRSRLLRDLLKEGNDDFLGRYAARLTRQVAESVSLADLFASVPILVPVPASHPARCRPDSVPAKLAAAMVTRGLGSRSWSGLTRMHAVRRSTTARPGARPTTMDHYASFAVDRTLSATHEVVLVDDVVTRGRTLLAAAARIQEAYPGIQVRAFAMVRTMGLVPEIDCLLDPCRGEIRWRNGDAHRWP